MRIEHVALWTADLERLRSFYERHFAARSSALYHNASKQFSSYFLSFADGARLEIMSRPGLTLGVQTGAETGTESPQARAGYAHFALALGSRARVDELTSTLREAGVPVVDGPRTTGDGYYESVVLDPDGNRIELTG